MADQAKKPKFDLKLTDTPNVAQVIRIVAQMQYQDRWYRRLWRWLRPDKPEAVDATVVSIESAASAKKRIDASGKVVTDSPIKPSKVVDSKGDPAFHTIDTAAGIDEKVLHEGPGGRHVGIDALADRKPKS